MRLIDVILNNVRRRWGRKLLLVLGLTVGVATVVALMAITSTMKADISAKRDEYGANSLILPKVLPASRAPWQRSGLGSRQAARQPIILFSLSRLITRGSLTARSLSLGQFLTLI